jgi:hypothetical protein
MFKNSSSGYIAGEIDSLELIAGLIKSLKIGLWAVSIPKAAQQRMRIKEGPLSREEPLKL